MNPTPAAATPILLVFASERTPSTPPVSIGIELPKQGPIAFVWPTNHPHWPTMHTVIQASLFAHGGEQFRGRSAPVFKHLDGSVPGSMDILSTMNAALAEVFSKYLKSRTSRWQVNGARARDRRLVVDETTGSGSPTTHPLAELREDNSSLAAQLRDAQALCLAHHDSLGASQLKAWVDQADQRDWFLRQAGRRASG